MARSIVGAVGKIKYFRHQRRPRHDQHKCYADRREALSRCGYGSYNEYLASDEWKEIRRRLLELHPRCVGCGKVANQIHHLQYSYEVLLGLEDRGLASVCRDCHKLVEFDGRRKRNLWQTNDALLDLAKKAGNNGWAGSCTEWLMKCRELARQKRNERAETQEARVKARKAK